MLCVVDDAHWLDPATTDALLFCARRLGADRVLLVFSARDAAAAPFRPDGIDELVLTGLDPDAARALLEQRVGRRTAPRGHRTAHRRDRRQPARTAGAPDRAQRRTSSRGVRAAADPAAPHRRASSGPSSTAADGCRDRCSRVLLLAAADDTGELALIRRARRQARASTSRLSRPPSASGLCSSTTDDVVHGASPTGALGHLPGRHRRSAAAPTGRWPMPSPGSGTPTGRPGTAPPRPRAPTPTSSRRSSSSARAPNVAARYVSALGGLRARGSADRRPHRSGPR